MSNIIFTDLTADELAFLTNMLHEERMSNLRNEIQTLKSRMSVKDKQGMIAQYHVKVEKIEQLIAKMNIEE